MKKPSKTRSSFRITFRKKQERYQNDGYQISLNGQIVGHIALERTVYSSRWYWYSLTDGPVHNTYSIDGSATDLEGCKAECREYFKQYANRASD